ncbi:MAG: ABC transporter permease [Chloroflexota bacterium]|jgi:ABC-2 type transport system permease protein
MTTVNSSTKIHHAARVNHLRLVWALASKDIVDALKNKTTLTTIVISLLMVLVYKAFPALTADSDALRVWLYAESPSTLVTELERSPLLAVDPVDSLAKLKQVFPHAESTELAIVIPDSAVAQQQAGQPVTIEGYLMYWVSAEKRAEIKAMVEEDLSAQLGQPVTLDLTGHDVYFDADVPSLIFSPTFSLLFVTLMIGISLIPNLMVEEKQNKTLDLLLVSPASTGDLVAGKTLAGLFYGLAGSAVVFIVFRPFIIRWDLAILTATMAVLFMAAIGLLLGSYVKVRAQLQLVAWFVILPLLIPVFLVEFEGLVPSGAIAVMNWIPTVLIARIFRLSLTPNATLSHYGPAVLVVGLATLALLGLVVWVVRRADRR